jgi:23S rRNA (adenine2503-C2)-methyltransferase
LLQGKLAHVNLIPWNQVDGIAYERTEENQMKKFQHILENYGVPSTIRVSLGDDIAAACGQLAKKKQM